MGTVIKFSRVSGRLRAPERAAGASAVVIILPVVRIERGLAECRLEAPAGVKAKAARSVAKAAAKAGSKSATGPSAKPLATKPLATKPLAKTMSKAVAKPATARKPRRKRAVPALPSPACGRG
jgi:hypothetical protein